MHISEIVLVRDMYVWYVLHGYRGTSTHVGTNSRFWSTTQKRKIQARDILLRNPKFMFILCPLSNHRDTDLRSSIHRVKLLHNAFSSWYIKSQMLVVVPGLLVLWSQRAAMHVSIHIQDRKDPSKLTEQPCRHARSPGFGSPPTPSRTSLGSRAGC